jgi:hypothetical protein
MSNILQKTNYSVWSEGSLVKLQFGNIPITMEYSVALELAQFLRLSGRQAKSNAGDKSRTMSALGLLTDAETDEKRIQGMRDATAAFKVS